MVAGINETVIVDDYTIDIVTNKPCPILLNKLVDIFIVSKEYQEKTDKKWLIGTGAYKLIDNETDNYVILERFDDYWKGPPVIKNVTFKVICDSIDRKNSLINRTVDITNFHPKDIEEIQITEGLDILSVSPPTVMYIGFDFRETNSSYRYSKNIE